MLLQTDSAGTLISPTTTLTLQEALTVETPPQESTAVWRHTRHTSRDTRGQTKRPSFLRTFFCSNSVRNRFPSMTKPITQAYANPPTRKPRQSLANSKLYWCFPVPTRKPLTTPKDHHRSHTDMKPPKHTNAAKASNMESQQTKRIEHLPGRKLTLLCRSSGRCFKHFSNSEVAIGSKFRGQQILGGRRWPAEMTTVTTFLEPIGEPPGFMTPFSCEHRGDLLILLGHVSHSQTYVFDDASRQV